MSTAWVALGSNLDNPAGQVAQALAALRAIPDTELVACSRMYRSAPWGLTGQPDFINAVVRLRTGLSASQMLAHMQAIETAQGRDRSGPRWGPRTLDLDLLMFDQLQVQGADLVLPHPRIAERAFVLLPLAELSPQLDIPGQGRVDQLLAAVDRGECHPLSPAA